MGELLTEDEWFDCWVMEQLVWREKAKDERLKEVEEEVTEITFKFKKG